MTLHDPAEPHAPRRKWHMSEYRPPPLFQTFVSLLTCLVAAYFANDDLPDAAGTLNAMGIQSPPEGMFQREPHRRNRQQQQQQQQHTSESDEEDEETTAGPSRRRAGSRAGNTRSTPYAVPAARRPRQVSPTASLTSSASAEGSRSMSLRPVTPLALSSQLSPRPTLPPMTIPTRADSPIYEHIVPSPSSSSAPSVRSFTQESFFEPPPSSSLVGSRPPEYVMSLPGPDRLAGRRMVLGIPVHSFVSPRRREDDEVLRKFN